MHVISQHTLHIVQKMSQDSIQVQPGPVSAVGSAIQYDACQDIMY